MKSSLKTLLAVGALALAAGQASASTLNAGDVFDHTGYTGVANPWSDVFTAGVGVTGAIFKLEETDKDWETFKFQLYDVTASSNVGSSWTWTDAGDEAFNLANVTPIYRALISGHSYSLNSFALDSNGRSVSYQISAVPLPAAAWLFGSALLGMGALRRKQAAAKDMAAV